VTFAGDGVSVTRAIRASQVILGAWGGFQRDHVTGHLAKAQEHLTFCEVHEEYFDILTALIIIEDFVRFTKYMRMISKKLW
jgi:hypothetical protein